MQAFPLALFLCANKKGRSEISYCNRTFIVNKLHYLRIQALRPYISVSLPIFLIIPYLFIIVNFKINFVFIFLIYFNYLFFQLYSIDTFRHKTSFNYIYTICIFTTGIVNVLHKKRP